MWNLPGPEIEPMSPALPSRFLTTGPPRKSKSCKLLILFMWQRMWTYHGSLDELNDFSPSTHHVTTWNGVVKDMVYYSESGRTFIEIIDSRRKEAERLHRRGHSTPSLLSLWKVKQICLMEMHWTGAEKVTERDTQTGTHQNGNL